MPSGPVFSRRKGVESRRVEDGTTVLVDVISGVCYELNRMGSEIWEFLAPSATAEAICEVLARQYRVDSTTLSSDVRDLLKKLIDHKLIEANEPPGQRP